MTTVPLAAAERLLPGRRAFARASGWVLVALGVGVMVGWFAGIPILTSVVPGLVTMRPLTALSLVALGVVVALLARDTGTGRPRTLALGAVVAGLSLAVAGVGVATLVQEVTGATWGYENLFGLDTGDPTATTPGRPPPATAVCLLLMGAATLAQLARRVAAAQWLALLAMVVAYLAALGYAFGVSDLYRVSSYTSMAVHTSIAMVLCGLAVLHLRPDQGLMSLSLSPGPGGLVVRRVLPVMVVVPTLVGLFGQVGVARGWFDAGFATAAILVVLSVGGGGLLWRQAANLERTDDRRVDAEVALARIRRAEADRAQAMHRLEVANADLERFAAIAAHDLRAPLTTIRGYAELIGDSPVVAAAAGTAELATRIERLVARGTEMIDDLLTYSRSGLATATLDTLSLQPVAEQIATEVGESAERDAKIEVLELPQVIGETGQLRQLFQNLLGNAVKYCPADRVPHVVVDALPPVDGHVTVRVTDNGLGIPEAERESLFAIFERGTRTTDIAGSGVGLAICERIVGRHGGRIWVEHGPGEGARFCFTLAQRLT